MGTKRTSGEANNTMHSKVNEWMMPAIQWRHNSGNALAEQLHVRIVVVIAHAVGHHGGHERLDRAQHRYGYGRAEQSVNKISPKSGDREMRQAARYTSKPCSDRFDRQLEEDDCPGAEHQCHNRSRNAVRNQPTSDHDGYGAGGQDRRFVTEAAEMADQGLDAQPENPGNFFELQSEKIFYLRAGNQNRDTVGETDHNGARNELHRRTHAGQAHDHKHDAGHDRAHEQAVDTVDSDDSRDHHDERAGRARYLSFRAA